MDNSAIKGTGRTLGKLGFVLENNLKDQIWSSEDNYIAYQYFVILIDYLKMNVDIT